MSVGVLAADKVQPTARELRLVITASSFGTVFEWYDFFVYGTLAALLGRMFFPSENATAALLLSLATFGAGFGVRPIGAVVFGYLGDLIGRKYTFLATITLMGLATAGVGLLPSFASAGIWAPILLVALRLLQGLALGGEYGGAAIYVAEHAPVHRRGFYTSFIQASVIGGFLLSLIVVLTVSLSIGPKAWEAWGWRVPFLFSLLLLAISLWMRLKLSESPVFTAMKAAGTTSRNPLRETFATWGNIKLVFTALFGIAAGLTVVWYTAQFQALYFLQNSARVDETSARLLIGAGAVISTVAFVFFGWLSDKIGRKPSIIAGYALTVVLIFPLFHMMANAANPALMRAVETSPVVIANADCPYNPLLTKGQTTECGKVLDWFSKQGVSYTKTSGTGRVAVEVGGKTVVGLETAQFGEALKAAGYPTRIDPKTGQLTIAADRSQRNDLLIVLAVVGIGILSGATYGPVAALLVELFPARIRYTSMSIPYHIGTGYFGGFLPFVSQYMVAKSGNAFGGIWYTVAVVAMALVVTVLFLPETRGRDISL